jgi:hypothetical protein
VVPRNFLDVLGFPLADRRTAVAAADEDHTVGMAALGFTRRRRYSVCTTMPPRRNTIRRGRAALQPTPARCVSVRPCRHQGRPNGRPPFAPLDVGADPAPCDPVTAEEDHTAGPHSLQRTSASLRLCAPRCVRFPLCN